MKGRKGERMRGNAPILWYLASHLHSFMVCSETVHAALSHASSHPNARPCVFLIHYLKERNVGQTKINMAPWIRPCVFVRSLRGSDCCFNRRRMELFGSAERLSLCSLSPSHSTDQQPAPLSHDLDINTLFWSGQHSAVKPDSLGVSLKLMTWDWAIGLSSHFYILYTTF